MQNGQVPVVYIVMVGAVISRVVSRSLLALFFAPFPGSFFYRQPRVLPRRQPPLDERPHEHGAGHDHREDEIPVRFDELHGSAWWRKGKMIAHASRTPVAYPGKPAPDTSHARSPTPCAASHCARDS